MPTVAFATLGCKVNQVDTQDLARAFLAAGFAEVEFGRAADVTVVNSCTVTGRADRESRGLLLRARRASPDGLLVMTGCLPSRGGDAVARSGGADLIVDNEGKAELVDRVLAVLRHRGGVGEIQPATADNERRGFLGRARAFVKVQDGCDQSCAYCIVPRVRGRSRSVSPEIAVREAAALVASGFQEIVLTGIHLGAWGRDLPGSPGLADLCRAVEREAGPARLRLSSIEPGEVTGALLDWMSRSPVACPHLHIPMQSGDTAILAAMNRPYSPDEYAAVIERVARALPGVCLGADVLVGFPGETDDAFERTVRLVRRLPLAYLHVFPFSPRPGTPAAGIAGRVPLPVLRARAAALRALSTEKRTAFAASRVGSVVEVLVESAHEEDGRPRRVRGTTREYLRVTVETQNWQPGELRRARLVEAGPGTGIGRPA